jgi:hypothetical protein
MELCRLVASCKALGKLFERDSHLIERCEKANRRYIGMPDWSLLLRRRSKHLGAGLDAGRALQAP